MQLNSDVRLAMIRTQVRRQMKMLQPSSENVSAKSLREKERKNIRHHEKQIASRQSQNILH